MFTLIKTSDDFPKGISTLEFEEALDVWWYKPQVANRRLAGANILLENIEISIGPTSDRKDALDQISASLNGILNAECFVTWLKKNQKTFINQMESLLQSFCDGWDVQTILRWSLRKLIPRSLEKYSPTYEMSIFKSNRSVSSCIFMPLFCECNNKIKVDLYEKSYVFTMIEKEHRINLSIHQHFEAEVPADSLVTSQAWLVDTLFKKISSWCEAAWVSETGLRKDKSINLVDVEKYTVLYSELKKKYGPYFVENWPESTDAMKFVYEDIGLATYLLLLWENERSNQGMTKKQSFVDLGCGNGLLVHILSNEGHPGRGVDLNERKIWQMYGPETILQKSTIIPNELILEEDWIIGNHSDELTPWIPLIASRSSYKTRYFVLPCCFHDFYAKFHHMDQKKSHYENYLEFVRSIGEQCMFDVKQDTLRIPSTKRVCQVGMSRSYPIEKHPFISEIIERILSDAAGRSLANQNDTFKPRSTVTMVRNCSKLDEKVKSEIIGKITSFLLSKTKEKNVEHPMEYGEKTTSKGFSWFEWNSGGDTHLNELAELLDGETLKEMKAQCGGVQTLLKNNGNIFKVVGGYVSIRDARDPNNLKPSKKKQTVDKKSKAGERMKTKMCWFHMNHPQGCLFTAETCTYAHNKEELRIT